MNAKEYLDKKAISVEYQDFYHYADCRHENLILEEMPKWLEEYHQHKLSEITEERIRELLDEWDVQPPVIEKHNFPLDSFIELRKSPHVFRRYLTEAILNLLKGER